MTYQNLILPSKKYLLHLKTLKVQAKTKQICIFFHETYLLLKHIALYSEQYDLPVHEHLHRKKSPKIYHYMLWFFSIYLEHLPFFHSHFI